MSLDVLYSSEYQIVESGIQFTIDPEFVETNSSVVVKRYDLLFDICRDKRFVYRTGLKPISRIFGFKESQPHDTLHASHVPDSTLYNGPYDSIFYGSTAANIGLLVRLLRNGSINPPPFRSEKSTRHVTFSGQLTASSIPLDTVEYYELYHDILYKYHVYGSYVPNFCVVDSISPCNVHSVSSPSELLFSDIRELFDQLSDHSTTRLLVGGALLSTTSDFSYEVSLESVSCSYHSHLHDFRDGCNYDWNSRFILYNGDAPCIVDPIVDGSYESPFVRGYQFSYSGFTDYGCTSSPPPEGSFISTDSNGGSLIPLSDLSTVVAEKYADFYIVIPKLDNYLFNFRQAIDHSMGDIIASSCFSTVDAFKNAEGSLESNTLQTLQKLPSIAAAFPKLKEGVDLLGRIWRKDYSFSTLKELLDISTTTILQYSFEWRPYYDLFTRVIPEIVSTLSHIGDIRSNSTSYGSFHHKFTNEFGRKEVTLLTRTKMVMDVSPSSLASALLGVDAIGLLPKPSRLWSLLPFSFVADWFTGVGKSIERAEYSALLAGIPAYFVHSYLFQSQLTADELTFLNAVSTNAKPASLRVYYRDLSLFSPFPKNTRFDFGIPNGYPPLGAFGSLLYQLIFS